MPEGPECKIISELLHKILNNKIVIDFIVHENSRYNKHKNPDNYEYFKNNLPIRINSVNVKGKLIWFNFDNNITMLNTLGMSGIWTHNKEKHCDIELVYKEENQTKSIFFKDVRHFGTIKFLKDKKSLDQKLKKIGPDVLSNDFINFKQFNDILNKYSTWDLPKLLMNQSKISGIGNYLKAEILYASEINPFTEIYNLDKTIRLNLYNNIITIPKQSYLSNGVSIRDYYTPENNSGNYQFSLKVYNRNIDDNNYQIIKDTTSDKRTTYWCPEVQIY
mgnify:CR=1 FL=1